MKKIIIFLIGILLPALAFAQVSSPNFWKLVAGVLQPITAQSVSSTRFCLSGSCITVWPSGGSGSSSSTVVYQGNGILVTASGTNGYVITNNGVISTAGNWSGTWQLLNPSDFLSSSTTYLANNLGNWAGTVQGKTLGTISTFSSTDYLPSSTAYIANNTGNWAGTWGDRTSTDYVASSSVGTIASHPATDYLASSTTYLSTFSIAATTSDYSASTVNHAVTFNYLASSTWMKPGNNLSELTNTSTARTNLGVGSISTFASTDYRTSSTVDSIAQGGTNATSAAAARTNLGLGTIATFASTDYLPSSTATTTFANPSATIGTSAVNGSAATAMRSDAAPKLAPQFASSTPTLIIGNATTTASTTNYAFKRVPQARTLTAFGCYDTVGTTTLNIFIPKAFATTTVSSTVNASFACGTAGNTTSSNIGLAAGSGIIVEVSSTAGTPVSTFFYFDTTIN